jgi:hypothetical protein
LVLVRIIDSSRNKGDSNIKEVKRLDNLYTIVNTTTQSSKALAIEKER